MEILDIVIVAVASVIALVSSFMAEGKPKIYYFFKPLPIFLLIFIVGFNIFKGQATTGGVSSFFPLLILLGLCAGVTGDIFLLLPKRFFIIGLSAFLVGHLFYVAAFLQYPFNFMKALPMMVFIGTVAIIYGTVLYRKMKDKKIFIAMLFYIAAICTMTVSGFNFDLGSGIGPGIPFFTIGALLFCLSDSVLGWTTFINKFKLCELLVMTTYYGAQILITVKTLMILV